MTVLAPLSPLNIAIPAAPLLTYRAAQQVPLNIALPPAQPAVDDQAAQARRLANRAAPAPLNPPLTILGLLRAQPN